MTILTQDGRKLELRKRDKASFTAGTYVGRVVAYYVNATVRPRKHSHVQICLGEYETLDTAIAAEKELQTAFDSGKKVFVMQGNKGVAPADDLMELLKTANEVYTGDYCFEVGMIAGKTNESYGRFNPDETGSYAKVIDWMKAKYAPVEVEAKSA